MDPVPPEHLFLKSGSAMGAQIARTDWSGHPLGTIDKWPLTLRAALGIVLNSGFASYVIWGPQYFVFFNDPYIPILGDKISFGQGRMLGELWSEVEAEVCEIAAQAMAGKPTYFTDRPFRLKRHGRSDTAWFTFSYSPIREESGVVSGILCTIAETTAYVIAERRHKFQLALSDSLRRLDGHDDITGSACELLGKHMSAIRVGYADVDEHSGMITVRRGWHDGQQNSVIGMTYPMGVFGAGVVAELRQGLTVKLDDVATDPRCKDTVIYDHLGCAAMLIIPLLRDGILISVLSIGAGGQHEWTREDVQIAEDTGERTRAEVERAKLEQALHQRLVGERDRLHQLFEQAPGFIAVMRGPEHVYELGNDSLRKLMGPREFLGKTVREVHPDLAGQGFFELLDGVYQTAKPHVGLGVQLAIQRAANGPPETTFINFVYQPIFGEDGKVNGVFVEGSDVTEQHLAQLESNRLNRELAQHIDMLAEADRRKDEFVAMLAHELRNPLAPISAAAQLMKMPGVNERLLKQSSDVIARQVGHMTALVDDLIDVSRVTRGLIVIEKRPLDIRLIISDAVEQTGPMVQYARHRLQLDLYPEPAMVLGDHKRLVQVLANILNNAAKYTPPGGNIKLETRIEPSQVCITIADDGIGIGAELQPRIFDLFTQAERTSDRAQGGLGIGLALVRSLIELHGGSVAASSGGKGQGSSFTILLPRLQQDDDTGDDAPAAPEQPVRPLRILVVDDNVDAATMLALYLEACGHSVFVKHSARDAIAHAATQPTDLYLLDIGLPEMDGNALARYLRSQPATADALLVALTGYGQDQDRENSLASGFDRHLVKPVDPDSLIEILALASQSRVP